MMETKMLFNAVLRLAKDELGLSRLSQELGIDMPTLSKYSTGKLHPSLKRIGELMPRLVKLVDPRRVLERSLRNGVVDGPELNNVLATRPYLAVWAAIEVKRSLSGIEYSKVVTIEGGGAVIAGIISVLEGRKMVYALRNTYIKHGVTEPCTPLYKERGDPKTRAYITLPRRAVSRGEGVLIIDDVSWTGCTLSSLKRLVTDLGGDVRGVGVLAISSEILDRALEEFPNLKYLLVI